jgi:hypothetical protein
MKVQIKTKTLYFAETNYLGINISLEIPSADLSDSDVSTLCRQTVCNIVKRGPDIDFLYSYHVVFIKSFVIDGNRKITILIPKVDHDKIQTIRRSQNHYLYEDGPKHCYSKVLEILEAAYKKEEVKSAMNKSFYHELK